MKPQRSAQPPPDAKEMQGTYADRSEEAERIKAKAKLLFADMVKTGEMPVPVDAETELRLEKERNVAREERDGVKFASDTSHQCAFLFYQR